ncbi:MAG: hypothetical protein RLN88_04600 [Ekhidna sp.]|uniref:hypothetical protein n=1 Tax=Ekhidna sp. TaxID=2608089 RepID=UPI0032EBC845
MQIKNNHSNYLQNAWLIGAIKVVVLAGCLYFILSKLQDQSIRLTDFVWPGSFEFIVALVLFLMVFNWYLEALRWRMSVKTFESISMNGAWRAILGGLALNWVLPFTSGDLIARIEPQKDRHQSTAAAMMNRGIMLCFTAVLGLYGVSKLAVSYEWKGWLTGLGFLVMSAGVFAFKKPLRKFLIYFRKLKPSTFLQITLISFIRYAVFVLQFYLLLSTFLPDLSAELLFAGIGWIFLIRSMLPLFFGGVGVREASGILFFEPHVANLQLVIVPIFFIWIINTVIPSFIGLIFILRYKTLSA